MFLCIKYVYIATLNDEKYKSIIKVVRCLTSHHGAEKLMTYPTYLLYHHPHYTYMPPYHFLGIIYCYNNNIWLPSIFFNLPLRSPNNRLCEGRMTVIGVVLLSNATIVVHEERQKSRILSGFIWMS